MSLITVDSWCKLDLLKELEDATSYGRKKISLAKQNRPFCIVVCGVFSSGKTSLINALLGTSLPTGVFPVTKVVTKIRYGERPRIVLRNLLEDEEWEVTEEVAQTIIVNQNQDEYYRDFQIYIETPSEFLKDNIEIIDTPGLDDDKRERLDEVTRREIRQADFCIINYMSSKFANQSERSFLEEMQSLTNGNFVSVLNCLNYLQQGEKQLKALETRAKQVLGEYGNDRIGKGLYFRVDSRDKDDSLLDGLDSWLLETVHKYGKILQADTPLTMAHTELKRIKKKCDNYMVELFEQISKLREQNEAEIKKKKRQAYLDKNIVHTQISSIMIQEKDRLTIALTDNLRGKLENIKSQYSISQYCENAKSCIRNAAFEYVDMLQQRMNGSRGVYAGVKTRYSICNELKECIQTFTVPEPTYTVHERSLFDLDRYLTGKTFRVYNDYVGETINEIKSTLLPRLKLRIEQYFNAIEQNFDEQSINIFVGGSEASIQQIEEYANQLSECSLDALEVLREVRSIRNKLVLEYDR